MLRGLLRGSEASKALFERAGLFKTPELLEKYVIASEVTVEVLDVFLSRVFGTERSPVGDVSGELKVLLESLGSVSLSDCNDAGGEGLHSRADEPDKTMEGLRVKVENLERQLCALQRQLQMQGDVSKLASSLDGRLNELARECERRVSAVSEDVVRLEKEVGERASTGDVKSLLEEVSHLKEGERSLGDRLLGVDTETREAALVLRREIQEKIERLDAVMKMNVPFDPLNGIIAQLTRECGGNVHENEVIEVTGSSCSRGGREPKNAADLGTNSFFESNSQPDQWI